MGVRPERARVIALLPIALGVVVVATPGFFAADIDASILIGDALLLLASVVWAVYSIYAKLWAYPPWLLTRFLCLASAIVYLPLYLLFAPKGIMDVSWSMILLQGLYQGIGPTILAMLFSFVPLKSSALSEPVSSSVSCPSFLVLRRFRFLASRSHGH